MDSAKTGEFSLEIIKTVSLYKKVEGDSNGGQ